MDETNAFFTHTIVGAPFTTLLGKRMSYAAARRDGVNVNLATGGSTLTTVWRDWVVLSHHNDAPGQPRRRPEPLREHAADRARVPVHVLLDQIDWIDAVAKGFREFSPLLIANRGIEVNMIERQFILEFIAGDDHTCDPEKNNFRCGH